VTTGFLSASRGLSADSKGTPGTVLDNVLSPRVKVALGGELANSEALWKAVTGRYQICANSPRIC